MDAKTAHPNTVHGMSLIVLQDVPHRSQQEVEQSVKEIAEIIDTWIDAHSDGILKALRDLRFKLAEKYKGPEFAQSLDAGNEQSESLLTENTSVSVPIPINDTPAPQTIEPIQESSSRPVVPKLNLKNVKKDNANTPPTRLLPGIKEHSREDEDMPANFMNLGDESESLPPPPPSEANHADAVSFADNSLQFSRLVGADVAAMQSNTRHLQKQETISKYSKDILMLLCKMSLY